MISADRRQVRGHCAAVVLIAILAGSVFTGCDGVAADVKTTSPRQGEIRESFREPATTRLTQKYHITMPVDGRISRINLEPGDAVTKGQSLVAIDREFLQKDVAEAEALVAQFDAQLKVIDYTALEETQKLKAEQSVAAAGETIKAAESQVSAARVRAETAQREYDRLKTYREESGQVTDSQLDAARATSETALIELRQQEFALASLREQFIATRLDPKIITDTLTQKKLQRAVVAAQLEQAKAARERAIHRLSLAAIISPIDGVILERYEQGDRMLPAGQELLLIGNFDDLEVEAEVLTQDALRLEVGSEVQFEATTRMPTFAGTVKRIEPMGFTKLSALGVEQQRVIVVVKIDQRPEGLGVGFRLQAQFFTGKKENALIVPRYSVMQAPDRSFYVLQLSGKTLVKQPVSIGLRNDLEMEIIDGLNAAATIVSTPNTAMEAGTAVNPISVNSQ